MIPFDEIDSRLDKLGRDRAWLATASGRKPDSIRVALAPSAPPSKRSELLQKALSDAIEREEQLQATAHRTAPLQNLVMEFEDAEFSAIEHAALANGQTVREWSKELLNGAATMDVDAFIAEFFPDAAARLRLAPSHEPELAYFPVRLLRAAAGFPILADAEVIEHNRDLGEGRFLLELRGDSMEPRFHDRQRVVLRDKTTLKRPVLKYGELYFFIHEGAGTFKQWAKDKQGRKVLRSLNPEHPDIVADEHTEWIGWFDPADNA